VSWEGEQLASYSKDTERTGRGWAGILCAALLIAGAFYYLRGNTRWLAYDDEGGYLYAAWRITQGEMPYWDLLTP